MWFPFVAGQPDAELGKVEDKMIDRIGILIGLGFFAVTKCA